MCDTQSRRVHTFCLFSSNEAAGDAGADAGPGGNEALPHCRAEVAMTCRTFHW